MKKINRYIIAVAVLLLSGVGLSSCDDFLDRTPTAAISNEVAITDQETAELAVRGMYSGMRSANIYAQQLITMPGLLSDETFHAGTFSENVEFDANTVFATNITTTGVWRTHYSVIYRTNSVLQSLLDISDEEFSPADKDLARGQALFIRGLMHFNLANYYGDVPIAASTDLGVLNVLPRSPKNDVYAQVIADLTEAESLLPETWGDQAENKTLATKAAARAALARVNLYAENYSAAADFATQVINTPGLSLESDYASVFTFDGYSSESIFEIHFDVNNGNSLAFWHYPASQSGRWEFAPDPNLVFALEDFGGSRLDYCIDPHPTEAGAFYCSKYNDIQNGTDRPKVFRLAEMYLIRAEARAQTGNVSGAVEDINALRERAGAAPSTAGSTADVLLDIETERFVELCFEGHRWLDLVRTGRATDILSLINPDGWQPTDELMPIPQREIQQNPNLTQNPGY